MLIQFFQTLKRHEVPVTVREFLDFIDGLTAHLAWCDQAAFYHLARTCLVKDERFYDRFDRACTAFFDGVDAGVFAELSQVLPEEWLRRAVEKSLSPEERAALAREKDLRALMEKLAERLAEQKHRHQGGNRMVGTGGTSPFGAYGDHPEGVRMAGPSRKRSAVKVWEARNFKNLDSDCQLDTRSMKVALKALRSWARTGPKDQLDIDETLKSTAKQAGWLDLQWRAERHNAVKVLLFFDVGGSMDPFIGLCERLFSAAKTEFKHLKFFYFHNMVYEAVWPDASRRRSQVLPVWDLLRTFSSDYRVIFVGDAAMSPYELLAEGGCTEYWNEEPGQVWLSRILHHFPKSVWLNPEAEAQWHWAQTTAMIQKLMTNRMFPLTLAGIQSAMSALR